MRKSKTVCDRCGSEDSKYYGKIKYETVPPFMCSTGTTREVEIDLCQECMWTFQEAIKNFNKQK